MITLYVRRTCPFCLKTIAAAQALAVPLTIKEVSEPGVMDELIARGGKRQMPFLVDDEHQVSMYESDDIIAYLHSRFSSGA